MKPIPKHESDISKVKCAYCGKEFEETGYSKLSRFIMQHKPTCSYECNKSLKQTN